MATDAKHQAKLRSGNSLFVERRRSRRAFRQPACALVPDDAPEALESHHGSTSVPIRSELNARFIKP